MSSVQQAPSADVAPPGRGAGDRATSMTLALIVIGGLVLRLLTLGDKSIWLDESFSLWVVRQPFDDFWRYMVDLDLHPPAYFLSLRGWAVFGDTEVALRSFSVLWSILTLPVVFGIGRAVGGRLLGLLSAGILAVSPLHIEHAQQARMYSMVTFFAAAATLCLLQVLGDMRPAGHPPGAAPASTGRPRLSVATLATPWWVGLVVCTTVAMLTHNVAVLLPFSFGAFLVLVLALPGLGGRGRVRDPLTTARLRNAAVGVGAAVALWLPWSPTFVGHWTRVVEEFWIPAPTPDILFAHWRDVGSAFGPKEPFVIPLALAFLALAALGAWGLRRRPMLLVLLMVLVLVPFAAELVVSLRRPIFYTRTIIWSTPPFYVLLAAGLLQLRVRAVIATATAALLALNLYSLFLPEGYYRWEGQEAWRDAAAQVATQARPGDLLLFSAGWTQLPFDYYYRGPELPRHGLPVTLFERGILEPIMTRADTERLDSLTVGQPRVWLLYSHFGYADPRGIVPEHLGQALVETDQQSYSGIMVFLYELRS